MKHHAAWANIAAGLIAAVGCCAALSILLFRAFPGPMIPILAFLSVASPAALAFLWFFAAGRILNRKLYQALASANGTAGALSASLIGFSTGDMTGRIEAVSEELSAEDEKKNGELGSLAAALSRSMNTAVDEFNSITARPARRHCFTGANNFQEGRVMGERIGHDIGGTGKAAVIAVSFDQVIHGLRAKGCVSALREEFSGIEVLVTDGDGDNGRMAEEAARLAAEHPDLKAVYVTDGQSPPLICDAVAAKAGSGRIPVYAHDITADNMALIRSGKIACLLAENFYAQTYNAMIYLYNALASGWKPVSRKIYMEPSVIDGGNHAQFWDESSGKRILTDREKSILARPVEPPMPKKLKLAAVLPVKGSFFEMGGAGADAVKEVLTDLGCEVEVIDCFESWETFATEESMGPRIQEVIDRGFDGFAAAVFDRRLSARLDAAVESGLTVVTFNSEPLNFREIISNVFDNLDDLKDHSTEVAAAAEESARTNRQITSSMEKIEERGDEQRRRLSATEENLKELNGSLSDMSGTMDRYAEFVEAMEQEAVRGGESVNEGGKASKALGVSIRSINDSLAGLGEEIDRITGIIDTIDTFSSDTNVLAINASIQAARAGEAGRSFAIIAGQIRALSQQSAQATEKIQSIIRRVHDSMDGVIRDSDENLRLVGVSEEKVSGAGEAFVSITDHLKRGREDFLGIRESMEKINSSADSIGNSVEVIDGMTVENVGNIHEIASSIRELASQSQELSKTASDMMEMARNQGLLLGQFTL